MKKIAGRKTVSLVLALMMVLLMAAPCFATDAPDFVKVVTPIVSLLNALLKPLLLLVGAVGALYCVILGVKYARAEEPQDREKAKQHLKSAIIGFVLIFVLIVVLNLLMPILTEWAGQYQTTL